MAWTNPKTWSVGETLTASNFNTHVRDNLNYLNWQHKVKTADQTVNNSAVLVNDTHLVFAVATSEVWHVEVSLMVESNSTADFKFAWTVPAGATLKWAPLQSSTLSTWVYDGTNEVALGDATTTYNISSPASGVWGIAARGIAQVGGTAGNVQLQWAQNTATGINTNVKQGSLLIAHRVST